MTKTAIITGASSGIGEGIARRFANEGFNLVLVARRIEKLQALQRVLKKETNASILVVQTDVTKKVEVAHMVTQAREKFGSIDIYVNNAGVMLSAAITDGVLADWEEMIDVNIKGALYGLYQVIPNMIAQKSGHIINIASVSGLEVTKKSTVYSATKFAVRAISIGLEKELAHTGVRVTNISPGMVDTPLTTRSLVNRKMLETANIADAVFYAISQPGHVNVNEITVRPV